MSVSLSAPVKLTISHRIVTIILCPGESMKGVRRQR